MSREISEFPFVFKGFKPLKNFKKVLKLSNFIILRAKLKMATLRQDQVEKISNFEIDHFESETFFEVAYQVFLNLFIRSF